MEEALSQSGAIPGAYGEPSSKQLLPASTVDMRIRFIKFEEHFRMAMCVAITSPCFYTKTWERPQPFKTS